MHHVGGAGASLLQVCLLPWMGCSPSPALLACPLLHPPPRLHSPMVRLMTSRGRMVNGSSIWGGEASGRVQCSARKA